MMSRQPRRRLRQRVWMAVIGGTIAVTISSAAYMKSSANSTLATVEAAQDQSRVAYALGGYPILKLSSGKFEKVHSLLNITTPMKFGDYVWDDKHIPTGRVWVRIDLQKQTLSVFRAGHEIGSTIVLYGTDGKPTPSGIFPVLEKSVDHRSTLYDAEMPFMLRLTRDGVAIHASNVREGFATHGCIGVPLAFARLLYSQVKRGDLVAILSDATRS